MPNNRDILIRLFSGITPVEGTEETVRVVAMEKDFHVDCYVCEVPHLILYIFAIDRLPQEIL
jgi:hypothetical protein